ncbi:MAG: N-formylglutamate amidohydrolase [Syntrophomonadaceae bacterium]|nr:N-formylglutamate amidohydrolase [Syntrophomonadaceae bacterium]
MAKHFSVAMNRPFAGTFVPSRYYRRDQRGSSIRIEVNRGLYMNEANGNKNDGFDRVKEMMQEVVRRFQTGSA